MIDAYTTETVLVVTETKNSWGEITGSASVSIPAKVDWITRKVVTGAGEEIFARATILLNVRHEAIITQAKLLTFEGKEYEIVNIQRKSAFSVTCLEVWIK